MSASLTRLGALGSAAVLALALAAPTSAGTLGKVSWTPTSVNFGKVQVGLSAVRTVWVTNGLKVPALIIAESLGGADPGQFAATGGTSNDCYDKLVFGEFLDPGETCGWLIRFGPQAPGSYAAKFSTALSPSPDLIYAVTVNLRGTGY